MLDVLIIPSHSTEFMSATGENTGGLTIKHVHLNAAR
jgi:hypothetical protein